MNKDKAILVLSSQMRHNWAIKGLANGNKLAPIQEVFLKKGAVQCGFCTPGMALSTKALLDKNPNPTKEEIKAGMTGNLCRCMGYTKIIEAIQTASQKMSEGS